MDDLEQSISRWRQELEATLAFSTEEIDELEDHLRFSLDAKIKQGASPEQAWLRAQGELGSASALAVEFAKQKLMPALWRLLVAWWRPACLMIFLAAAYGWSFSVEPVLAAPGEPPPTTPASRTFVFWATVCVCLSLTLIFLPKKSQKNAVLAAFGNAFGIIPLLHVIFYNPATETWIGPGWAQMVATFNWSQVLLGAAGLVGINIWWWKRSADKDRRAMAPVIGTLILVLALSPFASELVGNLSIRNLYSLRTPAEVTNIAYINWEWADVMLWSLVMIINFLPFVLTLVAAVGIGLIQFLFSRQNSRPESEELYPSHSSLLWIMLLFGSGLCWIVANFVEPGLNRQFLELEKGVNHPPMLWNSMEAVVLFSATFFFISGYEITRRLIRASRLRLFYAVIPVIFELSVALLIGDFDNSIQPLWLAWLLWLAVLALAFVQSWLIVGKSRRPGEISLWKFEGPQLVELGLQLGLVYAGTWLILIMVAVVMAFESVSEIHALINWGTWIQKPLGNHYDPSDYGTTGHLTFWVGCGMTYLAFCLAAGLFTIIVLSALEFIRFNAFRLYKVGKIRRALTSCPVPLSEAK